MNIYPIEEMVNMAFNWELARKRVLRLKMERARLLARLPVDNSGTINDFSIGHVAEVKEAGLGKFLNLDARIKKEFEQKMLVVVRRRLKIAPTK